MKSPTIYTNHAKSRGQQRGIPPLAVDLLCEYGEISPRGSTSTVTFSKKSKQNIKRYGGSALMPFFEAYSDAYLVISNDNDAVITVGHRHGQAFRSDGFRRANN